MLESFNMPEYPKEQLWKIYEKLPEELKEAIFSEETAESIGKICQENEVQEEKIPEIARYTGHVFMGLLSPDEFQETLETELELESEIAKKIAFQINRYIFRPVQESLRLLYEETKPKRKEKEKPKKKDTYRELIE